MAWRKPSEPAHIEPPGWYRTFDPAAWDEPDGHELRMMGGWFPGEPWPADLHAVHAERRWGEAKYAYRREHPALATQEFKALVGAEREDRAQEKRRFGGS